MKDLDFQGLELPILTDKELLEQAWNLEDENEASNTQGVQMENVEGEDNGKRGREEEEDGATSSRHKKARTENAVEQQEETLNAQCVNSISPLYGFRNSQFDFPNSFYCFPWSPL